MPSKILRRLNLSSLSIEALMNLEVEFYGILENLMKKPPLFSNSCVKACPLCEKIDAMEFLGEFFCFAEGIKRILIPRYVLFAMIAFKAFKVHLLPFSDNFSQNFIYELFHEELEIEFFDEASGAQFCAIADDIFKTLMASQFTTLFYKDKVGFGSNGWQGGYDFQRDAKSFRNYFNSSVSSYPFDGHMWCNGSDHHIDDDELAVKALNSVIMFLLIGMGVIKNRYITHSELRK